MDRLNDTDGAGAFAAPRRATDEAADPGVADVFALDPRSTLNRLRAVVYDWDIASDRLTWGANAAETLAAFPQAALATGAGFAELVAADSASSRVASNGPRRPEVRLPDTFPALASNAPAIPTMK